MKYTFIEDISVTLTSQPLDINQLLVTAMFGGDVTSPQLYDPTKTYNKGAKILYIDPTSGKATIYSCKKDRVTGAFDVANWTLYNLFQGSGGGGGSAMSDVSLVTTLNNITVGRLLNI